jgi:predicted esterase
MSATELGFVHRFVPATSTDSIGATTLLLLHGTGGDEENLLPLGGELLPGAAQLSPRGKVLERGMPRFFRRLAEGVFDLEDLAVRTAELVAFVDAAAREYGFDRDRVIAVGFSNGANIAASAMLAHPGSIRAGVLFSPMLPFEPAQRPNLSGTSAFIGAGRADTMIPPAQAQRLIDVLRDAGADVTDFWHPSGHTITPNELVAAKEWVRARAAA